MTSLQGGGSAEGLGGWKGECSVAGDEEQEDACATSKCSGMWVVGEEQPAPQRAARKQFLQGRSGFSCGGCPGIVGWSAPIPASTL